MEEELAGFIAGSVSPLSDALKLAAAGNLIDMGPERMWKDMRDIFRDFTRKGSSHFDYQSFETALRGAGTLLYVGDNAGEIVLDKILIGVLLRETDLDITYVVRGSPLSTTQPWMTPICRHDRSGQGDRYGSRLSRRRARGVLRRISRPL
jgi:uncharacterized protein with ATP-grasp and redox domains